MIRESSDFALVRHLPGGRRSEGEWICRSRSVHEGIYSLVFKGIRTILQDRESVITFRILVMFQMEAHFYLGLSAFFLLNPMKQEINNQGNGQKDDTQSQGQFKIAFVGFQGDRRGHDPGIPGNIPADDQDRPHLGHDPSESGDDRGHDAITGFVDNGQGRLQRSGP